MTRARLAGIVAALAGVGAVALGLIAIRSGGGGAAAPVTVERAVATAVPATVAPRPLAPTTAAPTTTTTPPPPPATDPPDTTVVSPLAALLPPRLSARPEAVVVGPAPVALGIEALGVAGAEVVAVGVDGDGALEIPDAERVGWYRLGSSPGRPGATVLTAHINYDGVPGVFAQLGAIEPGAPVVVDLDDGTTRTYEVVERTSYAKDALPAERVWATEGDEVLVLITCGGAYDPAARRYADNIVAYAVPVA